MSSSLSSRACFPATSALVIAESTIRRVEDRISSRALMATVRSERSRSLRALMASLWQPCGMRLPPIVRAVGTGGLAAGVGLTAYAVWETRAFRLRDVAVPLLPPGQPSLRVLHLSDIHL